MSAIDVESLAAEISPDAPCGANLEYDAALSELERIAQGKPEQQMGDTVIAAEEPDFPTRLRAFGDQARRHFDEAHFREFCERHLGHLDEVAAGDPVVIA